MIIERRIKMEEKTLFGQENVSKILENEFCGDCGDCCADCEDCCEATEEAKAKAEETKKTFLAKTKESLIKNRKKIAIGAGVIAVAVIGGKVVKVKIDQSKANAIADAAAAEELVKTFTEALEATADVAETVIDELPTEA